MLIECVWKYEYIVNLRKMAYNTKYVNNNDLMCGIIMLFGHYWQINFDHPPPHTHTHSHPSEVALCHSHTPIFGPFPEIMMPSQVGSDQLIDIVRTRVCVWGGYFSEKRAFSCDLTKVGEGWGIFQLEYK